MTADMTAEELERLIARFGADLALWPAEPRARALALAERDPSARALMEESAALDLRIAEAVARPPTADEAAVRRLAARLAALPPQGRRPAFGWLPLWLTGLDLAPAWPSIAALAGMAALGFVVGSSAGAPWLDPGGRRMEAAPRVDVSSILFEPGPIGEGKL